MRKQLDKIRKPAPTGLWKQLGYIALAFLAGAALGLVSKALDENVSLPLFLETLDLGNFFSRMGVWIFFGVCISLYSKTAFQAACNVFVFFAGMVGAYYAYTILISGFYPKEYMTLWVIMTLLTPFMGAVCWYAGGTHTVSICISAFIFMIMTRQAFAAGFGYFDIRHGLELLLWGLTVLVLYKTPKQIAFVSGAGFLLFLFTSQMHFFWGML